MKILNASSKMTRSSPSSGLLEDVGLEPFQIWAALLSSLVWLFLCGGAAFWSSGVGAQTLSNASLDTAALQQQVHEYLGQQTSSQAQAVAEGKALGSPLRVEVVLGQLDPRLKLAPCDKVKAYLPEGVRLWGKSRVGLRCEQGPVRWNVAWPVTVKIWGQALVPVVPLRPGAVVTPSDVHVAEVDLAAVSSPAVLQAKDVVGRLVIRNIPAGQSLRQDDIKVRRWFAAGDPVRLLVKGAGFSVASEGVALTAGDEGQCARVRLEGGRIVCGDPVAQRQVEIML